MKYLVKQVIRSARIANKYDLVVQNWPPMKVMDLYLGVRHFFDFPAIKRDPTKKYHGINALSKRKGKPFGEQ